MCCYSYDQAVVYLKQADYDLDLAIETYMDDEKWEREHPFQSRGSGMSGFQKRRGVRG